MLTDLFGILRNLGYGVEDCRNAPSKHLTDAYNTAIPSMSIKWVNSGDGWTAYVGSCDARQIRRTMISFLEGKAVSKIGIYAMRTLTSPDHFVDRFDFYLVLHK